GLLRLRSAPFFFERGRPEVARQRQGMSQSAVLGLSLLGLLPSLDRLLTFVRAKVCNRHHAFNAGKQSAQLRILRIELESVPKRAGRAGSIAPIDRAHSVAVEQ